MDRVLVPKPLPDLLSDVGAVGGQQQRQGLHGDPRYRPLVLAQPLDEDHHRRDRGVELEFGCVHGDLADAPGWSR